MKYTYRSKKTYKLKHKLKLLLTILFAVLISTTGYIMSKNAYSDPSPYGTATVTYNSGTEGQFDGGATTNTVVYNLRKKAIRYSHTSNVDDTGHQDALYPANSNTNEVITILGASTLTVDLYYNSESTSYDWLSVWTGSHSNYTAGSNYNSTGKVTTANGAPDNTNKFGGRALDTYTVNGNTLTNMNHCTLTIQDNSVTFAFKSDGSGFGDGYGYYAIITADENEVIPTIDDIVSGEYKEPISLTDDKGFNGWDVDMNTISATTTVNAVFSNPRNSGTYDGVTWRLHYNGSLLIGDRSTTQTFTDRASRSNSSYSWYSYRNYVKNVIFVGNVNGTGSMASMFYDMKNVENINLVNFNTQNVTSMASMFKQCYKLDNLDVSTLNTSNVTSMFSMFTSCEALSSIDISTLNTSKVTNMQSMFSYCKNLSTVDLSFNDLSKVTSVENMFYDSGITYINMYSVDVSSLTSMAAMFMYCNELRTVTFSRFNSLNVTNMRSLFFECGKLETINFASFNTSSATDMGQMFRECKSLTTVNFDVFNTSNVTIMDYMFAYCRNLTTLDLSSFNTSKVIEMNNMFCKCFKLTNLNISSFNTSLVTKMHYMFDNCQSLTQIDLHNITTPNVTDMSGMFQCCSSLTSLDLSSFDTSNVTGMGCMFYGCETLTSIDLTPLNTSNVIYMDRLFCNCKSLTNIDLTPLDTSNVINIQGMFSGCESLTSINLEPLETTNVTTMSFLFENCKSLTSIDLTPLDTSQVQQFDNMFNGCRGLTIIDITSLDTSSVQKISGMFARCSNLLEIDLSNFNSSTIDVSNQFSMNDMFYSLPKLNKLILGSNFAMNNTVKLVDSWQKQGTSIVYSASDLMNNYDGSTMAGTYLRLKQDAYYALLYENGDFVFQIGTTPESGKGNVIGTYADYIGTSYNYHADIPWYNNRTLVKQIIFKDEIIPDDTSYWFKDMMNLEDLVGMDDNLNMGHTFNAISMFENCSKLRTLDFSNVTLHIFSDVTRMFAGCTHLRSLNVSSFGFDYYVLGANIFENTTSLKELTLGETDWKKISSTGLTGNWIKDGDTTVWNAVSLINEYVPSTMAGTYRWPAAYAILYDTGEMVFQRGNTPDPTKGNVVGTYTGFEDTTYANYTNVPWFAKRTNVTTINFQDIIMPTSTAYWFTNLSNLSEINDIERLNTSSVTNMSYMFSGCTSLTNLDLSSFDTSFVTNMSYMLWECSSLTNLDVSNFDMSKVTTIFEMFRLCRNLQTIDLSGWDTSNITDMTGLFMQCSGMISLDLSNFDTSNVTTINSMFAQCTELKSIDLSSFDTSQVTNMRSLFLGDDKLIELVLGTNWEFLSNSGLTKSWKRDGDNTVYTADALTSSYNGATMAGTYRSVVKLTITETVKGTIANINKNFNFTINVKNNGIGINSTHAYTGSKTGNLVFSDGNATFTLKHNQNISVYLPEGNTYTITQSTDGYTVTKTNDTGTLNSDKTATFIDTLNGTTPSGIFIDLIPFILLIIFGILGIFLIKKFKYL